MPRVSYENRYGMLDVVSAETPLPVLSKPYTYSIAEREVYNHTAWKKLGYASALGTSEFDIWAPATSYAWPTGSMGMQVVSTNASDTGTTGSGAGLRTVVVYYLDTSYTSASEILTLNGTNAVNTTASNLFRINGFRATTAGSNSKAAGNISLKDQAGSVTYSMISAGYTQARNSTYTVPDERSLYVTSITVGVENATKGVRVTTRADYDDLSGSHHDFFFPYMEVAMTNGTFYRPFEIPSYLPAHTRLKVSAIADQAGAICTVSLRGWLEVE